MGYEVALRELAGRPEGRHTVLPWSLASLEKLPGDEGGVYALWCSPTGKCVYVGRTQRPLRTRLKEHWGLETSGKLACWIAAFGETLVLCYHRCNQEQARRIEARLILAWQPEANVRGK